MITSGIDRIISRKIHDCRFSLAEKLVDHFHYKAKPGYQECHAMILTNFFQCLGEALYLDEDMAVECITQWAIHSRHKYAQMHMRNIPTHFPIKDIKLFILDLIEEEAIRMALKPSEIISQIKKVDQYLELAKSLFTSKTNHKLLKDIQNSRSATDEERITLQEITALKSAMKEATILVITDRNDRITYANEKFCNLTQYSFDELNGKTHYDLFYSGYHDTKFFKNIRDLITTGKVWKGEICNKAKDGSLFWVDATIVPFLNQNGELYEHIAIMFDITEKKATEEMLWKMEKLSFVGELAAGFAHEIRNPLTTIKGFVQIMDSHIDEKDFYRRVVLEEIDRINLLVNEFMVFAKPHAVKFRACNIIEIIQNIVQFLSAEALLKGVDFTGCFDQDEIWVYGEPHQLTQVFLNVMKNAMDALPSGGQINLSYSLRNNEISVFVEDNGVGMTPEQVKKVGQPFYTTKENGNGLGLMVSYKIIENHHGKITVMSEIDKGTTFILTFPVM